MAEHSDNPTTTTDHTSQEYSRYGQKLALLSYVLVAVFIGVPLWWKTTEVYRSPLPYTQINELANKQVSLNYKGQESIRVSPVYLN